MLKVKPKKYIWVIGVPRSGTTFLTDYLCKHTNQCYNEPWDTFIHNEVDQWAFPETESISFKYCMNWRYAKTINERFRKSYFIHLIRNPSQVVYSLVFPKVDSYPPRKMFEDKKTIEEKFKYATEMWFAYLGGSQSVCRNYYGIELTYENLTSQIGDLSRFLKLPLDVQQFNFKNRNDAKVDKFKFEVLENLWRSKRYMREFKKREEIELVYYKYYKFNKKFYYY